MNRKPQTLIDMGNKEKFIAALGEICPALVVTARETEFHFRKHYICAYTNTKFSKEFVDTMFSLIETRTTLYHYTTVEKLKKIASSGEFRLYAVKKRLGQGELGEFAKKHNLSGYLNTDSGKAFYKELACDLFYTSFTNDSSDNPHLWDEFANGGKGVRLKIQVTTKANCELRPIQYSNSNKTLLIRLNAALKTKGLPPFTPWTISKIGAFYLPNCLKGEDETRLLIKRHIGNDLIPAGTNDAILDTELGCEYWPLKLGAGQNDYCDIEVIEIVGGKKSSKQDILDAVASSSLSNVSIKHPAS